MAPRQEVKEPDYYILFFADQPFDSNHSRPLPDQDITIGLPMLNDSRFVKIVRNGNYTAEHKTGVFAAADWLSKTRRGGIFLHHVCGGNYLQSSHPDYQLAKTSNNRAVVLAEDFKHASPHMDVDRIDNFILITGSPLIPAISKMTKEHAVPYMITGRAMESSAGDPTQAGRIRRGFFYDPFLAKDLADHANIFYEIIQGIPHMNYCLLNTGGIGGAERYKEIRLEFTLAILDSSLRGGLEDWMDSPTGSKVPKAMRYVDDSYLHPEKLFSETELEARQRELNKLNKIRYESVCRLGDSLHAGIRKVVCQANMS